MWPVTVWSSGKIRYLRPDKVVTKKQKVLESMQCFKSALLTVFFTCWKHWCVLSHPKREADRWRRKRVLHQWTDKNTQSKRELNQKWAKKKKKTSTIKEEQFEKCKEWDITCPKRHKLVSHCLCKDYLVFMFCLSSGLTMTWICHIISAVMTVRLLFAL